MSKLFGFYVPWIQVVLFTFILCFVWIIQRFMLFMNLGCLYGFVFRMDDTKVYVIYELVLYLWFVLYYVTDLDFGFVDF